jgi:hypothetical protein
MNEQPTGRPDGTGDPQPQPEATERAPDTPNTPGAPGAPDATGTSNAAPADSGDPPHDAFVETAARLGGVLGRAARRAVALGEEAAREARPEAERLAQQARAAAEAARPRIEEAGRQAIRYVRDHDEEIKRAAIVAGEITARQVMPARLRPIVHAIEADRWRRAPLRDDRMPPAPRAAAPDAPGGSEESPTG